MRSNRPGRTLPLALAIVAVLMVVPMSVTQAEASATAGEEIFVAADDFGWQTPAFLEQTVPFQVEEPKPKSLRCTYTCDGDPSQNWILLCSLGGEDACCDLADSICPRVVPGSTGSASCSC